MTEKNPDCPKIPGSLVCLDVVWPVGIENLCRSCPWWDEFAPEEEE